MLIGDLGISREVKTITPCYRLGGLAFTDMRTANTLRNELQVRITLRPYYRLPTTNSTSTRYDPHPTNHEHRIPKLARDLAQLAIKSIRRPDYITESDIHDGIFVYLEELSKSLNEPREVIRNFKSRSSWLFGFMCGQRDLVAIRLETAVDKPSTQAVGLLGYRNFVHVEKAEGRWQADDLGGAKIECSHRGIHTLEQVSSVDPLTGRVCSGVLPAHAGKQAQDAKPIPHTLAEPGVAVQE